MSTKKDVCPVSAPVVTQAEPVQPQVISTNQKNQFVHHSQSFSFPHDNAQQGNPLPAHQSYPRLQQASMHYHMGPLDPAEQQHLNGGQVIGHPRFPAPYQSQPQGFPGEQARPHMPVQPYPGHYDDKVKMLGPVPAQVRAQVHMNYGAPNAAGLRYKGQLPMPHQPVPHQSMPHQPIPHQMHQSRAHQHNEAQMAYYRSQRPPFHPNQGPVSYHQMFDGKVQAANVKSGHLLSGPVPLGQRSQGQISSGHVGAGRMPQLPMSSGQRQPGMHLQSLQLVKGQMPAEQMVRGQMPMPHGNRQHHHHHQQPQQQQSHQQQPHQQQQIDSFIMHGMMEERYSRAMQQGLENMINMESGMIEVSN